MEIILIDLRCFSLDTSVEQSEHEPPNKNTLKGWSFSDFLMANFAGLKFVFDKQERNKLTLNWKVQHLEPYYPVSSSNRNYLFPVMAFPRIFVATYHWKTGKYLMPKTKSFVFIPDSIVQGPSGDIWTHPYPFWLIGSQDLELFLPFSLLLVSSGPYAQRFKLG